MKYCYIHFTQNKNKLQPFYQNFIEFFVGFTNEIM